MLKLILPAIETIEAEELHLEHSLVSLSKWEAIHEKPFFGLEDKTAEEVFSYIRQMLLTEEPPFLEKRLLRDHHLAIQTYINTKRTGTTFRQINERPSSEIITTELVYYWLVQFQIPFQPTEAWHFNRTMTLIKIAGIKQTKPKKMNPKEHAAQMRELNAKRREALGSAG